MNMVNYKKTVKILLYYPTIMDIFLIVQIKKIFKINNYIFLLFCNPINSFAICHMYYTSHEELGTLVVSGEGEDNVI